MTAEVWTEALEQFAAAQAAGGAARMAKVSQSFIIPVWVTQILHVSAGAQRARAAGALGHHMTVCRTYHRALHFLYQRNPQA